MIRHTLIWLLVAAGPAAAETDYELIRDFDVIALQREYAYVENPTVMKWERPIRFHVGRDAPVGAAETAFLAAHFDDLSALTGIAFSAAGGMADANFRVLFVHKRDLAGTARRFFAGDDKVIDFVAEHANCLALYGQDGGGALATVTVLIPVDGKTPRQLRRCILEETTQSMGLVNDAPDVGYSLFNSKGGVVDEVTPHDRILLRLLYHPRIRAGMGRAEALRIAREVLPELR
jgi:hypothetical protein